MKEIDVVKPTPTIIGNLPIDTVTVDTSGGSMSAILKQSIRGALEGGAKCFGAKLEFEPGVSCVLVAPAKIAGRRKSRNVRKIRILRVSENRYVLDLENDSEEVIDPVTKATFNIIEEMIKARTLKVVDQDEMQRRLDKIKKEGEKAVAKAELAMDELTK